MTLYFAYGSNLFHEQMRERCSDSTPIDRAILRNYKLVFKSNKTNKGVADIIPCQGSKVYGALYSLSEADENKLDGFEGVPSVYRKKYVTVETRSGEQKALVYVMLSNFQMKLPHTKYFQRIFNGYKDWVLPTEHLCSEYLKFEKFLDLENDGLVHIGKAKIKKNKKSAKLKDELELLEIMAILSGYQVTFNSSSTLVYYQFTLPNNKYELSLYRDGKAQKIHNITLINKKEVIMDTKGEELFEPIRKMKEILSA